MPGSPHPSQGTRITGYLCQPLDLSREGCEYSLKPFTAHVPAHCKYLPPGPQTLYLGLLTVLEDDPCFFTY